MADPFIAETPCARACPGCPCTPRDTGTAVVAEARRWIGTPYCHQASTRGAGADCLGLIRGVWRAVLGPEPEDPGAYTADWAEATGEERLLGAALRHMARIAPEDARVGDMLLFRMVEKGPAKHAGILSSPTLDAGRLIHAYSGHAVCETRLTQPWLRRMVGIFRFPAL